MFIVRRALAVVTMTTAMLTAAGTALAAPTPTPAAVGSANPPVFYIGVGAALLLVAYMVVFAVIGYMKAARRDAAS